MMDGERLQLGFTGHRNKLAPTAALDAIAEAYPFSVWVHGGARGFDSQVAKYAEAHAIPQVVMRPDYGRYGKRAPLVRNRAIVDRVRMVFAYWDGRKQGGTYYTINYGHDRERPVYILDTAGWGWRRWRRLG